MLIQNDYFSSRVITKFHDLSISLPIQLISLWNFKLWLLGSKLIIPRCLFRVGYPEWLLQELGHTPVFRISLYLCQFNSDLNESLNLSSQGVWPHVGDPKWLNLSTPMRSLKVNHFKWGYPRWSHPMWVAPSGSPEVGSARVGSLGFVWRVRVAAAEYSLLVYLGLG